MNPYRGLENIISGYVSRPMETPRREATGASDPMEASPVAGQSNVAVWSSNAWLHDAPISSTQ
jgi:hypothetical protein